MTSRACYGFSLIEMAVVLCVLGLLLGGLLGPLSASVDQTRMTDTKALLAQSQEALLGFAVVYQRLPCPDTNADGDEDCPATAEGELPWRSLALGPAAGRDAWGNPLRYRVDGALSNAVIGNPPDTTDGIEVRELVTGTSLTAGNPDAAAAVVFSPGKDGVGNGENGNGDVVFTEGAFCVQECTTYFDDRLSVLSRHVVIARMTQAGRWP